MLRLTNQGHPIKAFECQVKQLVLTSVNDGDCWQLSLGVVTRLNLLWGQYFQTVRYDLLVGHKVNFMSLMIKKIVECNGSFCVLYVCTAEKAMAPHSSTLAWKIPWNEEPGRLQSMGSLESDTTEWLHFHFSLSCIGKGNGNPHQCSCLENPRDGKPGGLPSMGRTESDTTEAT